MISYELCLVGVAAALALRSAPRPFKRKFADKVARLLGNEERPGLDELDASRGRVGESTLPGFEEAGARPRADGPSGSPRSPRPGRCRAWTPQARTRRGP